MQIASRVSIRILALGLFVIPALAQDPGVRYRLIELTAEGGGATKAYAINITGQIVGFIDNGDVHEAAHWHYEVGTSLQDTVHFGLLHPYPLFNRGISEAFDISDADQIVGTAQVEIDCDPPVVVTNGFIFRPGVLSDFGTPYPGDALTNLRTLGAPCDTFDSAATGISNANHVVGWVDVNQSTAIRAFLVTPVNGQFYTDADVDGVNDLMIDLGALADDADPVSAATAVNDTGVVTGYAYTSYMHPVSGNQLAAYRAFIVTPNDTDLDGRGDQWFVGAGGVNTLMQDIGTLNGVNSWGRDINNDNVVVGESDYNSAGGDHYTRAFAWDNANGIRELGTLYQDDQGETLGNSAAAAINDQGVVVGWAENFDNQRRAFVYLNGTMYDLNDLICQPIGSGIVRTPSITLTEARDINEDGVIVGWGSVRGSENETRAFVLSPIDPDECLVEEEEDEDADDDDNGIDPIDIGNGGDEQINGDAVVGTPNNLGEGQANDDGEVVNGGGAAPAGLCGAGAFALLPLTLISLIWMKRR